MYICVQPVVKIGASEINEVLHMYVHLYMYACIYIYTFSGSIIVLIN